ncbi:hypothetical protein A3F97_01730 [Candidatus Nomurabacteria bacterium RIFCSPLOWO2_12_FULL_41_10]|uniref:Uncharacterized protein n=1 Tax=Candidatus Nomurabacteria bacterium RIFCSPLOWO2_12_FULL_41_10 TaxID=1801795 RepID=A0A1F6YBJ8_9BACT|nr:MAG: hypothetical protein A3F49_03060 [Candidatus Nomurabacteria bacterium RIFCSPHIGHO2_12_FULL_42_19]OGJ03758.1 MAG: hypothetical protein A3F97_01730 [Candidatus Nomurabacteria bacterium RIFCSPLOWO2_12_FULL_41_10]
MKKIFKGLGLVLMALLLVVGVGASSASATLTVAALTVTSNGALTVEAAAASNTIYNAAQTSGTIAIGGTAGEGTITLGSSSATQIVNVGTGAGASTVNVATGAGANTVNIATGATAVKAVNIATGAIGGTVIIGNVTGATAVTVNTGTGHFTANTTGTGDVILNSDDTVLVDADGVLELNSSAGVISIGNDADAQNIGIGTGAAARTITVGNISDATAVNVNTGTGGMLVTTTGAGDFAVASGDDVTINGVGASDYTIGAATTTGTMTIGGSAQTGLITIRGGGVGNVNAIDLTAALGTVTTEAHGLDVVTTGTMGTSGNIVGVNSVLTPVGSGGTWASGVYGKVVQATAQRVSGYLSGGEFEVSNSFATASNEMFPLVLDANSNTYHANSAFIWAQDFGSAEIPNLIKLSGITEGDTALFSDDAGDNLAVTHTLKIRIDDVDYWILLNNVGPN